MSRNVVAVAVAMALVLLAGCRTARQRAAANPVPLPALTPSIAEAKATAEQAALQDLRDEVDLLLLAAGSAAASDDPDEFHDCEALVFEKLSPLQVHADSVDFATYVADVLDELGRLSDQVDAEEETEEPPPEPMPVAREQVAEAQATAGRAHFDLPVIVNPEVTSLIEFYTGRYRDRLIAALERASHYLPFIHQELAKAQMPADLGYLPLVESAFNPRARSRARAQGLWQFIAGTGRLYNLRCDGLLDERNDPYLSTQAAVRHLSDLHATFNSWELALAAYNSGAGKVQRAIQRGKGETDFWKIRKYLPRETRNYVPAMWAALVVSRNPSVYGLPTFAEKPDCFGRVPVEGALDLEVLAERGKFDLEDLSELNPALVRRMTPINGSYQLAVPCGREQQVAEALAAIPEAERIRRFLHVVKRGDTPASIARHYGSTVDAILAANSLRSPRSLRVGQTLVVPHGPVEVSRSSRGSRHAVAATVATTKPERYVVKRGDTLSAIARRFGTSTDLLLKRNNLAGSTIRPGDVLVVAR
jgi:membrane-bound lytic murein transglycosylase D